MEVETPVNVDAESAEIVDGGFKQPSQHVNFTITSKKLCASGATPVETGGRSKICEKSPEIAEGATLVEPSDSAGSDSKLPTDVPYKIPPWSSRCPPENSYFVEILKNGCIVDKVDLATKSFHLFGRQNDCNFQLEHPSISRYHTVLQYRGLGNVEKDEIGWHLYDLGSTHGTFVNKQRLPAHMHVRFKVGHVMKLGGSTRLFILQGPNEDVEAESELTVTEIKQKGEKLRSVQNLAKIMKINMKNQKEAEILAKKDVANVPPPNGHESGIDWGMGLESYGDKNEGEDEDDEGEKMDFEDMQKREQFYIDDPKKALKNFFDRQGFELTYEFTEKGSSSSRQWNCRVELPVETSTGRTLYAEVTVSGGKKEATAACALEGCRMLDAYGVLRKSNQDSKKRPAKNLQAQDFYDSDEDNFFDRTGELERKRISRLKRSSDPPNFDGSSAKKSKAGSVDTFQSLQAKLAEIQAEIDKVNCRLADLSAQLHGQNRTDSQAAGGHDPLDDYMMNMSRGNSTSEAKVQCSMLRLRLVDLNQSASRYKKLVALARPSAELPRLSTNVESSRNPPQLLTGKMRRAAAAKTDAVSTTKVAVPEPKTVFVGQEEIEVDEDEDANILPCAGTMPKNDFPQVFDKNTQSVEVDSKNVIEKDCPHEVSNQNQEKPKEKMQKPSVHKQSKKKEVDVSFVDYDRLNDPDYAVWMPPEDQQGDGRTSLNDKLGY